MVVPKLQSQTCSSADLVGVPVARLFEGTKLFGFLNGSQNTSYHLGGLQKRHTHISPLFGWCYITNYAPL